MGVLVGVLKIITAGPSAAWTAAGGVTGKAVLYVLFFLAGAALFGVLAVWFHRRHRLRWPAAVAGTPMWFTKDVGDPVVRLEIALHAAP